MSNNKTPVLTPQLARLAAHLLWLAAEDFSNHGSNDFDLTKIPGFETREARSALDLAYHAWNGDRKEHDPDGDHRYGSDSALMSFVADVLDKTAGKPIKKGETERRTIDVQNATSAAQDAGLTASSAVREYQDARTRAEARVGALRRELEKLERLIKDGEA